MLYILEYISTFCSCSLNAFLLAMATLNQPECDVMSSIGWNWKPMYKDLDYLSSRCASICRVCAYCADLSTWGWANFHTYCAPTAPVASSLSRHSHAVIYPSRHFFPITADLYKSMAPVRAHRDVFPGVM